MKTRKETNQMRGQIVDPIVEAREKRIKDENEARRKLKMESN